MAQTALLLQTEILDNKLVSMAGGEGDGARLLKFARGLLWCFDDVNVARMVVSPPEDDVFNAVTRGVVHPRSHREVRALLVRTINTKK